ncbi:MAG: hypothetical protein PF517_19300 [Salinivirgaceae bacterium]|jgi:hypothetical protein|nr:hypothetical protein [Salinivirgaceae bacterium]
MSINTSNKIVRFDHFCLHQIYFKNIGATEFEILYDTVYEKYFDLKASIMTFCLIGENGIEKFNKKIQKKVFGEINWPTIRIIDKAQNSYSGYFTAVSGVNVKTFVGNKSISKVFDTPNARYCYIGNIELNNSHDSTALNKILEPVLSTVGLSTDSIVRNWVNTSFEKDCIEFEYSQPVNAILAVRPTYTDIEVIHTARPYTLLISHQHGSFMQLSDIVENVNWAEADTTIDAHINLILDRVEELFLEKEFQWSQLFSGYAIFSSLKDAKVFTAICKERKIPAAPFMKIQRAFKNSGVMFDVELSFAKGNEA